VWFYVRGEEYSAELDHFVRACEGTLPAGAVAELNSFASAAVTDRVIDSMLRDAEDTARQTAVPAHDSTGGSTTTSTPTPSARRRSRWAGLRAARRRRAA
jgi:hypothetical protein